jgi:hypothetical protein
MSRKMPAANTETFRVTISTTDKYGRTTTETYGPYATLGAAKASITRETDWPGSTSTFLIERAELNWTEVPS